MKSSSYAFSKSFTKKPKLSKVSRSKKSLRCKDNFVQMMELRKKILLLRDIIDLPPLEGAASINELVVGTMEDLQKLYPEIISDIQYSEMKATCIEQSLAYFCTALKSIGDSWMLNHEWRDKSKYNLTSYQENSSFNEIVESVLNTIECIVSMANERFDVMEEYVHSKDSSSYSRTSSFGKCSSSMDSCSETNSSCCSSPETPTSVLANFRNSQRKSLEKENVSCSSPLLWSLRVQSVEKLNPIDIKHLLLPRLSHCGVNVCPVSNKGTTVKISTIDVDDKLLSKETGAADRIEEIEVSGIKEERLDRNEEIKVSGDIKEEELDRNEEMEVNDDAKEVKLDRNEEIEVSDDIKKEKLDRNEDVEVSDDAKEVKLDRNEEIEVSDDIKNEKLDRNEDMEVSDDAKEVKLDRNEEMEVSVDIKKGKLDRNEEMEVSDDIKEEKLDLSRGSSQKNIAETIDDINSEAAETGEELPAPELPDVASKPSPPLAPVSPPPPPPPPYSPQPSVVVLQLPTPPAFPPQRQPSIVALQLPTPPAFPPQRQPSVVVVQLPTPPAFPPQPQPSVVALQLPTAPAFPPQAPPPPPPPMMQQSPVRAQPLPRLPPPPPLPQITVLPTAAAPTVPPPPTPLSKVVETVMKMGIPPPPPMVTGTGAPPPPPPIMSLKGGAAASAPPPPMALANGCAPPPPPPGGAMRSSRGKKSSTKLKRSHQLGNLYRTLKGKVEGSNQNLKSANGRKGGVGSSNGGKQGMADALAEMTKRSAYFQQIEEDVKKHAKSITELKPSISSFQSSDMNELLKFHKHVESILESLTDESQVLARFEGFPIKKLEALRTASALYLKFDAIVYQLQNWKIVSPMGQLLDRVENYFTKIKGEVDALERTKDDESKKFRSHGIQFDFNVLIRIKEAMVDVSSSCMELALKEKRELKAAADQKTQNGVRSERSNKVCTKMLWRAFQFAYRVYTFAGGHDERADRLTRELALEIESEPHHL